MMAKIINIEFSFIILNSFLLFCLTYELPNCCPKNFKLIKNTKGKQSLRTNSFQCQFIDNFLDNSESNEFDFNLNLIPYNNTTIILNNTKLNINKSLNAKNNFIINGIRITQYKNEINLPNCNEINFIKLTEEIRVTKNSCIAKYNNEPYVLTCFDDVATININSIKKCCPIDEIYDRETKSCVKSGYDLNVFKDYFDHPTIFNTEPLNCFSGNKKGVIVEYFSKYHKFKFSGSALHLPWADEYLGINSYCLESVYNFNIKNSTTKFDSKFIETDYSNVGYMVRTCNDPSICERLPCIRRCCNDKEKLMKINGTSVCVKDKNELNVQFYNIEDNVFKVDVDEPKAYGVLHGQNCKKLKLNPDFIDRDEHYISSKDGSIHLPLQNTNYTHSQYCIENTQLSNGLVQLSTFLCFEDPTKDNIRFQLYSVGIIISCVFFMLTLFAYLCLPRMRNLPGKILICMVLSLLTAYIAIAIGQISPISNEHICYSFAFFIYFSLISAFSWINVMCFDIWLTFGTTEGKLGMHGRSDLRRFLLYSLYGWGLPASLTALTICLTRYKLVSDRFNPGFGQGRCWFQYSSASHVAFFIAPVGVLVLINFVLFIMTLKYCNQVKREIHRMQSTNQQKPLKRKGFINDKARLMMNLKLIIVMGITWILEILSTIFYSREYHALFWMIFDAFNLLQGLLIFLIYVFKWRVWNKILDRFGIETKPRYGRGVGTTAATTSTFAVSSGNLMRMKSIESCSSLVNSNIVNSTKPISR